MKFTFEGKKDDITRMSKCDEGDYDCDVCESAKDVMEIDNDMTNAELHLCKNCISGMAKAIAGVTKKTPAKKVAKKAAKK